ncbi:VanZ family protein [Methylobacter sp.]|uniref:VanZ family protein n=1 Tax=Methylobacter sp. TaxID=2051955 RepID=UPI0012104F3D|nr:VanZ family protein [Methylobacter sp.]TAK65173.1 MAG: hypothetical protein EPO18_00545 [Methylobacter sp.]
MNRYFFYATALYLLFVIYGSLVPLEFKELPVETALSQFKNIRYLNIGTAHRADWIANILLYIPLAFGACAAFNGVRYSLLRALLSVCVLVFCLTLAVAIEFTQLYFPPRTVSLNDLIAETLGTVIGILSWHFFGSYFSGLYRHLLHGSLFSAQAAIVFYMLAYVSLSLFPFDFVTSFAELNAKLASGNDAAVLPFDVCVSNPLRCGVKLLSEILVLLPLGLLCCYLPNMPQRMTVNVLIGFFLGITIEVVQIFLLSGSAQGISVLTRMVGMGAGTSLFFWIKQHDFADIMRLLQRFVWFAVLPYLFLVLSINGWFTENWLSPEQALEKLAKTRFLPLYYFYFTTETAALVSLLSNLGSYLPVGLLCWASFSSANHKPKHHPPHWFSVGLLAAVFALIVETGKLFLANKHADPSDIWLAFIIAAGGYALLNRLPSWLNRDKTMTNSPIIKEISQPLILTPEKSAESVLPAYEVDKIWCGVSFILLGIIAAALFDYPVATVWLGLFLIGYAVLLVYLPYAWLTVIPALLPIMDFTPWTGRFFFDEFDLVVLTTLLVYYCRRPKQRLHSVYSITTFLLVGLFTILYGISLLRGLLPLQPIDANAFTSYYSNYNSLRAGKGVVWALLLLPLMEQTVQCYNRAYLYLGYGVLIGLTGVIAASCWERFLFPGLFDFSNNYRIIALFSTMHTGGGHIDAYLALTLPFIALLFLYSSRPWLTGPLGIGLFITGLYVLLVTFSRGPYIAAALEFVVLAIGLLWCFKANLAATWYKFLLLPLLLAIVPLIAMPVFEGKFIQDRFNEVDRDIGIRTAHWRDAINMMDDDAPTYLLGMGIGSYPRTYLWRNAENVTPAIYRIDRENDNQYLKLSSGDSLYMGQYVNVKPRTTYRLSVDLRSTRDTVALTIPICEKSLLYSFRCSWNTVTEKSPVGQWRHVERLIDSGEVGTPLGQTLGDLSKRPTQLSLYNGTANTVVDIDNVSLTDTTGKNLIANGDFTQDMDFWFFSTDNHLPWHIKNLPVHALFDQGWLGAIAFFSLFIKAIVNCCRHIIKRQNAFMAILLSSFSGFMVVGLVDSPFDAPRLTLLFFLMIFFALIRSSYVKASIQ